MTKVKLTIRNPFDLKKSAQGDFLVDTGAHYTVVPYDMVKKLKLKASFEQEFSLADGRIVRRPVGSAFVRYGDKEGATMVVLGGKNDDPLLGVFTLESFGLMIDPFTRKIYKSKLMLA